MFLVGLDDDVAQLVLGRCVGDGPQQGEAAALAVHRVLPSREGDVAAAAFALPDGEPDKPETVEWSTGKQKLRVGQLASRSALVVRKELDRHTFAASTGTWPVALPTASGAPPRR